LGVVLAIPSQSALADTVVIEDVGLQGRSPYASITRVRLLVSNPNTDPQAIELHLRVMDPQRDGSPQHQQASHSHSFRMAVSLGPGEKRALELPILAYPKNIIQVTALDSSGKLLAQKSRQLEPLLGRALVLVCGKETICQEAQTRISFSGRDEDRVEKRKVFAFVAFHDPPKEWWIYSPATAVVLASPVLRLDADQLQALELYVRQGGILILVEDLVKDSGFLAVYRKQKSVAGGRKVGRGELYWVSSLKSTEFDALFTGKGLNHIFSERPLPGQPSHDHAEIDWIRGRLAARIVFPGLPWLLSWLSAYILIVGLANFSVLRWLGRRELGWVTVPFLAVFFSGGLYLSYAAGHPKAFVLDQVSILWMDDRSPLAATDVALRVLSPQRATTTVSMDGKGIITGPSERFRFAEFPNWRAEPIRYWNVHLGQTQQVELGLPQWSFRDIELRAVRRLNGSVRWVADRRLRNETGQNFIQALFVDPKAVYFLGAVPAGSEVNLASAQHELLVRNVNRPGPYPRTLSGPPVHEPNDQEVTPQDRHKEVTELNELLGRPFLLTELIRGWARDGGQAFEGRSGIFLGLAEEPSLQAEIKDIPFSSNQYAVTIISLHSEP